MVAVEVWLLERVYAHEPGWIEGVYSTEERARAAAPAVNGWVKDGRVLYQPAADHFDPIWTITPYTLDRGKRNE